MDAKIKRGITVATAERHVPRDTSVVKTVDTLTREILADCSKNYPYSEIDVRSLSHAVVKNSDWTLDISISMVLVVTDPSGGYL